MVFKCQEDSYLKEFTTTVTSCTKTATNYEIILQDTILFPEGGGQPCDYGTLNGIAVNKVVRRFDQAVHIISEPLQVGDEVLQCIDWRRRFDHMQQHSGQHLITAVIDRKFGVATVSWWLGEEVCYIELDTPKITPDQIREAEEEINRLIREATPVTVQVYQEGTLIEEARSARGLPDDHKGDIRVIYIEGVEGNMCCGTHVTNLSQLQLVKLLHVEKGKKNHILLHFLVGGRVLQKLDLCLHAQNLMVGLLKANPSQHVQLVDKLQKNYKQQGKLLQNALKDVAAFEADKLRLTEPKPAFFSYHRAGAEADFMGHFVRQLGEAAAEILLFLTTGDEKTTGNLLVCGPDKIVDDLGPKICEVLDGKGAGKNGRFQAKVNKMANRKKAEEIVRQYFVD